MSSQTECLNRVTDEHSKTYDNFILIEHFNVGADENYILFLDINCL